MGRHTHAFRDQACGLPYLEAFTVLLLTVGFLAVAATQMLTRCTIRAGSTLFADLGIKCLKPLKTQVSAAHKR